MGAKLSALLPFISVRGSPAFCRITSLPTFHFITLTCDSCLTSHRRVNSLFERVTTVNMASTRIPTLSTRKAPAGALTTVWMPPPVCSTINFAHSNQFECYPPGYSNSYWFNIPGYYSPAICPSGFTSVCDRWQSTQGPSLLPCELGSYSKCSLMELATNICFLKWLHLPTRFWFYQLCYQKGSWHNIGGALQ